jgi:hypothetical protein
VVTAIDGKLELVPEHTTDFAGSKSQDTAMATAIRYSGTEVALESSSVHGVLSFPALREVNDEDIAASLHVIKTLIGGVVDGGGGGKLSQA